MSPNHTSVWISSPASFPDIPEVDFPPSTARKADAPLGVFLNSSKKRHPWLPYPWKQSTTMVNLKRPWGRKQKQPSWPKRHGVLQLRKGLSACEVSRTSSSPPSLLSATFPQACSPSTPSEHQSLHLPPKVWAVNTLTCLPTTPQPYPYRKVLQELPLSIIPPRTLNYSPEAELQTSWTTNRETFWVF